jgi:hypothetical protein
VDYTLNLFVTHAYKIPLVAAGFVFPPSHNHATGTELDIINLIQNKYLNIKQDLTNIYTL